MNTPAQPLASSLTLSEMPTLLSFRPLRPTHTPHPHPQTDRNEEQKEVVDATCCPPDPELFYLKPMTTNRSVNKSPLSQLCAQPLPGC